MLIDQPRISLQKHDSVIIVSPYRVPKISTLQEIYAEVGFTQGPAIVLTSLYFKPEQYYNKEGPFNKLWTGETQTGI